MKTRTNSRVVEGRIDVFLGFQVRMQSLQFWQREVEREQRGGEEIMAALSEFELTGDVLRDATRRANLEEGLELSFERYGHALDRLWWETEQ